MLSLEQMLLSNVHLGHSVKLRNPKMNEYIFCERNGIDVIDLLQTLVCLRRCCSFLQMISRKKKI
jgi:ribosomal protein S2